MGRSSRSRPSAASRTKRSSPPNAWRKTPGGNGTRLGPKGRPGSRTSGKIRTVLRSPQTSEWTLHHPGRRQSPRRERRKGRPEKSRRLGPRKAPRVSSRSAPSPAVPAAVSAAAARRSSPSPTARPREDAFRRDLTINALFYDIATYSVIDYVGGLDDLEARRARIIGDPDASFAEDPVRIWRVLRHASRLGFAIEEKTADAIPRHSHRLGICSGARLYEELDKDMKSGAAGPFFQAARAHGILPLVLGDVGEFYQASDEAFDKVRFLLGALDASVNAGGSPPPEVAFGLLLWPWAEPLLAGLSGDKPKVLYDAFRSSRATATVPKALLLESVHTLVIVEHMIQALADGKMRWALKERPRYPEASRITSLLVEGTFGDCDDPFSLIYRRRFGIRPRSRPHRYRAAEARSPPGLIPRI